MAFIFSIPRSTRLLLFAAYIAFGIVLSYQFASISLIFVKITLSIALVTATISFYRKTKTRTFLFQFSVAICAVSIGSLCMHAERSSPLPEQMMGSHHFQMIVLESPMESEKSIRIKCRLKNIIQKDSLFAVDQKIISYIFGQSESINKLLPGDQIVGEGLIKEIVSSGNPGSFDVKKFYNHQNIIYAVYLNSVHYTGRYDNSFILRRRATIWKNTLSKLLSGCTEDQEVRALTQAILLGDKSELTPELKKTFSSTGTAHVLAVSGLHIGIIYAILLPLIGSVKRGSRRLRITRLALFLIALWLYAMITGLSPSVCRAACMVSMLLIGNTFQRNISKWNILGFSAVILLLTQPFTIYQPGFQLSYAALAGIFLFYLPLVRSVAVPGKFLQYLWKMSCVSIAAQAAVMPIAIFYFHEVSLMFIFAGWIAVPATTLLLVSGIIYIFCQLCCPFIAAYLGIGISKFSQLLIRILSSMESHTHLHIDQLYLAFENAFAIYLSILFFLGYQFNRGKIYLLLSVASMSYVAFHSIHDQYSKRYNQELIIHSAQTSRLDLILGDTTYSFIDVHSTNQLDSLRKTNEKNDPAIHEWNRLDTLIYHSSQFTKKENIIITKDLDVIMFQESIPVLPVIISNQEKKRILWCLFINDILHDVNALTPYDHIVIDRSAPYYKARKLVSFCKAHHISVHYVREQGAFYKSINEEK